MKLRAYAKINWSLDITGIREDGYHLMDMVMQPVSLFDEITLSPAENISITTGGRPSVRADETNLAFRAAAALRKETGCNRGIKIHVEKSIPVGAGLGGGSSDAAAVLFGLNRLWNLGLSSSELEAIGLTVGADVPFCLRGGLVRTRGIGEDMVSYPDEHHFWLLVIQPCRGLSTKEIFQAYESSDNMMHPDTQAVLSALSEGNLDHLESAAYNVLEPVSSRMCPEIGHAVETLRLSHAAFACMTGSGSAVFGVFRNREAAISAQKSLRIFGKPVFLVHSQSDSIRIMEESR